MLSTVARGFHGDNEELLEEDERQIVSRDTTLRSVDMCIYKGSCHGFDMFQREKLYAAGSRRIAETDRPTKKSISTLRKQKALRAKSFPVRDQVIFIGSAKHFV